MFKKIATRYKAWEQNLLEVMRDPAQAQGMVGASWHKWAKFFADMPELERLQWYETSLRWPLGRLAKAALVLALLLAAVGGVVHLVWPNVPLAIALLSAEVFGSALAAAVFSMWFYYRFFIRYKFWIFGTYMGLACLGAITGVSTRAMQDGRPVLAALVEVGPGALKTVVVACGVLALIGLAVTAWRNAGYEQLALSLHAKAEQEKLGRQLTETQLRLLRAQIEPHFLFNTLGAVQQLAERDHARAAAELTASLIAFLRATAGGMARESATLREEFDLARAYLNVMQARLGDRLDVALDLPAALEDVTLPGMSVLTLAENAIKHGVEPARGQVAITLWAAREDGRVCVRVSDTGVGLSDTPSGGMGLQNLRDRLRLAFGPAAALSLYEQDSGGVVAEMALPVEEQVAA